jgi:hypothetical protein
MVFVADGAVLPPDNQRVLRVVEGVGAEAAEDGLVKFRAGCPDGQHHRRLLLAGSQGHHLVHLLVDPAGLVNDGQGEVQPLQPLRHGREDLERRSPRRHREGVRVLLHPRFQGRVELHHPARHPMDDAGLAFVGGDHHHLGALGAGQQLVQGQHRREAGFALPSREHPPGQPRPRPPIPGRRDQGPLPGPQAKRLAGAMAAGHPYVVGGEP